MAQKLGIRAKAYYNSATYGTPTWVEVTQIKDLSCSRTMAMADASSRGSIIDQVVPTTVKLECTGTMKSDASAVWTFMYEACLEKTLVDMLILDDAKDFNGATGHRADVYITDTSDTQGRNDGVNNSIKIECGESTNPVKAVLVTGGAPTFATITGTNLTYA